MRAAGDGRIVISQCGGFHGRFAAEAADAIGALQTFVTTYARYAELPGGKVRDLRWLTWPLNALRRVQALPGGGVTGPLMPGCQDFVQAQFGQGGGPHTGVIIAVH